MLVLTNMKSLCYCVFCIFICFATVSSEDVARRNDRKLMVVDDLIRRIRDDNWNPEEATCLENTLAILRNVKNLTFWATWVWESNQNPIGNMYGSTHQMGSYDQCMNLPWLRTHPHLRTQYCTADVKMTGDVPQKGRSVWDPYDSTEDYINTATKQGLYLNTLYWGVCVPASCSPRSVEKLLRHMYLGSQYARVAAPPAVTVDHCQVAGEGYQYPLGFYMFIATIVLLVAVAIASTVYQSTMDSNHQYPNALMIFISRAFCMKRNYNQLIRANPGGIQVVNGIRFITACLAILAHQFLFLLKSPIINPLSIEMDFDSLLGLIVLHGEVVVDTFFAMSGLFHVRGLMGNSEMQQNLVAVLGIRYLRLLGPLAATIFYLIYVAKYSGSGPFWLKMYNEDPEVCANNWMLSLMMLNTNFEEVCHIVTWYLACDYQLAILGTVLFYFYLRDKKLGYTAFGAAAALSVIIPGMFVYWHRLPVLPFPDLRSIINFRQHKTVQYNYTKSYVRANAYLVGVAVGYFMSVYKPADNRRAISTKWSLIGTIGCVVTMMAVMSLGKFFLDREYSVFESVIASSLNRAIWALAVCCVIVFCEYGNVPMISHFLSLPAFMPLSRLSYGIYLIHPLVIQRNLYSARTPWKYDKFSLLLDTLGTVCTSACISFFMWLLIEAPCINLSNILFMNKSPYTYFIDNKKIQSRNPMTPPPPQELDKELASKEVQRNGASSHNGDVQAACNKTKTS